MTEGWTRLPCWVLLPLPLTNVIIDKTRMSCYELDEGGRFRNAVTGKERKRYIRVGTDGQKNYDLLADNKEPLDRVFTKLSVEGLKVTVYLANIRERLTGIYAQQKVVDELRVGYPFLENYLPLIYNVVPTERATLLVLTTPELISEWRGTPESLILVHQRTNTKYDWTCTHCESSYRATPDEIFINPLQCSCRRPTTAERNMVYKDNSVKGAATESYFAEKLAERIGVQNVTATGQICNSKDDVVAIFDKVEYALQVKSLHWRGRNFNLANCSHYPANMIVFATDVDRKFFFVAKAAELPNKDISLTFTSRSRTYNYYKFHDIQQALDRVIELLPNSCKLIDIPSRCSYLHQLELESRQRFMTICQAKGLSIRNPSDNGTAVDLYAENLALQMKYSETPSTASTGNYQMGIRKYAGRGIVKPYSISDGVDFFVFETSTDKGHFLIIPVSKMNERGLLENGSVPGKYSISIYALSSTHRNEWFEYWDAFEQLKKV